MQAVEIVRDPKIIEILADPVRREILRLITSQPMTETQLGKRIMLTKPSIDHHLKILRNSGLIKIETTKIGIHGILEKYYAPRAGLFIIDWENIPQKLRRHFLRAQIERLNGVLSLILLEKKKEGKVFELTSDTLKELAQELAKNEVAAAKQYGDQELDMNSEMLQIRIYSEALKKLFKEEKWHTIISIGSIIGDKK